ncbi:unnamed protein product [Brassica oleracea]
MVRTETDLLFQWHPLVVEVLLNLAHPLSWVSSSKSRKFQFHMTVVWSERCRCEGVDLFFSLMYRILLMVSFRSWTITQDVGVTLITVTSHYVHQAIELLIDISLHVHHSHR